MDKRPDNPVHLRPTTGHDGGPLPQPERNVASATWLSTLRTSVSESEASPDRPVDRRFNPRFALLSLVVLLAAVWGVRHLHERHMGVFRTTLQKRIEQLEGQSLSVTQLEQKLSLLRQLTVLAPDDTDVAVDLARATGELGHQLRDVREAIVRYESLLRQPKAAQLNDVRLELVELLLEEQRGTDALSHVQFMLGRTPDDAVLHAKAASCLILSGRYEEAADAYLAAIKLSPETVSNYLQLATLMVDRLDRQKEAESLMDQLVARYPSLGESYAARGQLRLQVGLREGALLDARNAFRQSPTAKETLVLVAELLSLERNNSAVQGWFDVLTVKRELSRLYAEDPDATPLLLALSQLELAAGNTDEAIAVLKNGLVQHRDRLDVAWLLIDNLTVAGRTEEAEEQIRWLRKQPVRRNVADYLSARLEIARGHKLEAVRILESLRNVSETKAFLADVQLNLGKCLSEMQLSHRAVAAFQAALVQNPSLMDARSALCSELVGMGRLDEALAELGPLERTSQGLATIVRLKLLQQMRLPAEKQQWAEVESLFGAAARFPELREEIGLIRSSMLMLRGQTDEAMDLLRSLMPSPTGQVEAVLARALRLQGRRDEALSLLQQLEKTQGLSETVVAALFEFHATESGPDNESELDRLIAAGQDLPDSSRWRVLQMQADMLRERGSLEKSRRLWKTVAEAQQSLLAWRMVLQGEFDRPPTEWDAGVVDNAISNIRTIEGGEGPMTHLSQALKLTYMHAELVDTPKKVQQHLRDVQRLSAALSGLELESGWVAEKVGLVDDAISYYRAALQGGTAGSSSLSIVKRLVDMLSRQHREAEAYRLLEQFISNSDVTPDRNLMRQAAEMALQTQRNTQAIELASATVDPASTDYRDHVWLGQMLSAGGDAAGANSAFDRAAEMAGDRPQVWVEYVRFLSRSGQEARIVPLVQAALNKVPETARMPLLAGCHEIVGNVDEALKCYDIALKDSPDDVGLMFDHANLLIRVNQLQAAEPLLRRALEIETVDDQRHSLRRLLARVLSRGGTRPGLQEALALIEENRRTAIGQISADDLALAHVLGDSPLRDDRLRAASLLVSLQGTGFELPAESRLLLVDIYAESGKWEDAYFVMTPVLNAPDVHPLHLIKCITLMLGQGESTETVRVWLNRLQTLAPELEAIVELESWVLLAEGQVKEALARVESWSLKPELADEVARTRRVTAARLVDRLAMRAEGLGKTTDVPWLTALAETRLREQLAAGQTILAADLANLLARNSRYSEALDVVEATANLPPQVVAEVLLGLARSGRLSPDETDRIRRWLSAVDPSVQSTVVILAAADMRHVLGDFEPAKALYREVLSREPKALQPMNELAYLLALDGNTTEASKIIEAAIAEYGPRGFLLDTRSLIRIREGKFAEAVKDAEESIADQPNPPHLFRRVQALYMSGNDQAAADAWKNALANGLYQESLHPRERADYAQLAKLISGL